MGVWKDNKFLILSVLVFASLAFHVYLFVFGLWSVGGNPDEVGGLLITNQILAIFSMFWMGKSLVNLYRSVEGAVNRNIGSSLVAYGFYYLVWGLIFLDSGGYLSFLAVPALVAAGFLTLKRYFMIASVVLVFILLSVVRQILIGVSFPEFHSIIAMWLLPPLVFFLTTVIVQTSIKDEKYFTEVTLIK